MGTVSKVILRQARLCLGLFVIVALTLIDTANAQLPRVTPYILDDSLAVEFDFSDLMNDVRLEKLNSGIPLTFRLDLHFREPREVWFDGTVESRSCAFRIEISPLDDTYIYTVRDFNGVSDSNRLHSPVGVLATLEERLSGCLVDLDRVSMNGTYYILVDIYYRNLTYDDVVSADKWLREGRPDHRDSADGSGKFGESLLGLLWDMAGLKGESEAIRTESFSPESLRRAHR